MATTVDPTLVTNLVSGKVLHKETGAGIPNLLVELFDLEAWSDPESKEFAAGNGAAAEAAVYAGDVLSLYKLAERVGSVITDQRGGFAFELTAKDFNLPGRAEQKPDLILVVLAPEEPGLDLTKRLLHLTSDVYLNAGRQEAYVVRLPSSLLEDRQIPTGGPSPESEQNSRSRVSAYVAAKEREREFDQGVADYHGEQHKDDGEARKTFRTDFLKSVAADLSSAPPPGVVVADGDSIPAKNAETINHGIAKANAALDPANARGVPVNLYLTPEDLNRLQPHFDNAGGAYVEIPESDVGDILFRANSSENPGTLLVNANPIAAFCAAESDAEKCAKGHTDLPVHADATHGENGSITPTSTAEIISNDDMPAYLARLVKDMPSPDRVLQPELAAKRATQADLEEDVGKLSLPKGPAEVPATYQFSGLQVAFDHVWRQLFDEAIPDLAYTANVLGESRFGIKNLLNDSFLNGGLRLDAFFAVTPIELPPGIAKLFDITKDEYNEMSASIRAELSTIADAINGRLDSASLPPGFMDYFGPGRPGPTIADLRVIQRLTEQGDRLVESIRHDDNYTLHKTLRDLNDRLSASYEFTVFAADKDHHSVNFGLLTTYAQEWTPLAMQAGKLVKTIPLAPKEERRYSVKTKRNEKRSSKEAKKNNTSMTNEQASTSRVEAEILAKAQTKTNFGLTAEGDFDIGIASGKSTTTFGVEAINESSQNRKDFREAISKAIQEYKDEVTTEVSTESTFESDAEESGVIVNPNEELAVTYLFYELQKRYRLSERLYRVMPVVLVAQEVPSPDQITPAWVLANDWILNRCLLDDSFRPVLAYLANNSVGDDFSLREMRKNLRQQRNLVETLRIEFSSASTEADNRYKALTTAVTSRIDEEHAERTDGAGHDIFDFFGGGGQDPEAAKARELAAKDAHQYAVEKAEKANAALRQEINTLHALTEAYNKTLQARLDNETRVKRLLVHIRNNILYYMQSIWSMEPPDQRLLRLHKVQTPVLELEARSYRVAVEPGNDIFARFRAPGTEKHSAFLHGSLKHNPDGSFDTVPLVELADLTSPAGFMGNYMVFPMKAHNALTEFMAAPYIDTAFGAMDPDELSNVNLEQFSHYICCLHDQMNEADFEAIKPELKEWLEKLLSTPLRNGDEVVVPTGSLFIESLVDPNSLLEDFKLKHRELDVYKVQEEVRRAGLENLRLAARLLNAEREDPDIEKKIVVANGGVGVQLGLDTP